MFINLFDLQDGVIIPSQHCYSLDSLKEIFKQFPDQQQHLKVFMYIFYKTCSDPKMNPFFNMEDENKEELIIQEVKIDFSLDHPCILKALEVCDKLYDTPTKRAFEGMKAMMDKVAKFFKTQALSTGRDGSLTAMTQTAAKYSELRDSYKGIEKDYMEEIEKVRGANLTAYDMRD